MSFTSEPTREIHRGNWTAVVIRRPKASDSIQMLGVVEGPVKFAVYGSTRITAGQVRSQCCFNTLHASTVHNCYYCYQCEAQTPWKNFFALSVTFGQDDASLRVSAYEAWLAPYHNPFEASLLAHELDDFNQALARGGVSV